MAQFRRIVRRQALLMQREPEAAMAAIARLLAPSPAADIRWGMATVEELANQGGNLSEAERQRLQQALAHFAQALQAAEPPAAPEPAPALAPAVAAAATAAEAEAVPPTPPSAAATQTPPEPAEAVAAEPAPAKASSAPKAATRAPASRAHTSTRKKR
jgi:hypothetical protein